MLWILRNHRRSATEKRFSFRHGFSVYRSSLQRRGFLPGRWIFSNESQQRCLRFISLLGSFCCTSGLYRVHRGSCRARRIIIYSQSSELPSRKKWSRRSRLWSSPRNIGAIVAAVKYSNGTGPMVHREIEWTNVTAIIDKPGARGMQLQASTMNAICHQI